MVAFAVLTRGDHAAWTTPTRPFTAEERSIVRHLMERTYDRFIRRIVQGREMARERVEAAAEGRIWTGQQARELGLVDTIGGLEPAMTRARELGGLGEYDPVERWPAPISPIEAIQRALGGGPQAKNRSWIEGLADLTRSPSVRAAFELPRLLLDERTALISPYMLEIR